ncbi:hypothetical protein [Thalassotalea agariperforans]
MEKVGSDEVSKNISEATELVNKLGELLQKPEGVFVLLIIFLIYLANKGLLSSMFKALFDKNKVRGLS